ncbi:MAG: gamma carbonic anhydrase family protein [Flexistipes sinusarabici]|uniref:Gamma carbonic anhydrase family protein n=1 Tax=Flexistipes sinusarabici TaxID=2352 RepID=A0A5D0MWW3_FLESI|nr:gamma carbonic anhydrase family protein [Flexistipes sinusarabici]TYB36465.1 MAG: gamma carbonic anhydrase family protein [Flexistipes sinusarabici]
MENVFKRLKKDLVLPETVFTADGSVLLGDLKIGEHTSIWYNVVIRADVESITIGKCCNIQDGTVIHVTKDKHASNLGNYVSVGHNATLHGCTIGDNVLVGIGAIILDGVILEGNNLIAAGSLLSPGKKYPKNTLIKGSPAKITRELNEKEISDIKANALRYTQYKEIYLNLENT